MKLWILAFVVFQAWAEKPSKGLYKIKDSGWGCKLGYDVCGEKYLTGHPGYIPYGSNGKRSVEKRGYRGNDRQGDGIFFGDDNENNRKKKYSNEWSVEPQSDSTFKSSTLWTSGRTNRQYRYYMASYNAYGTDWLKMEERDMGDTWRLEKDDVFSDVNSTAYRIIANKNCDQEGKPFPCDLSVTWSRDAGHAINTFENYLWLKLDYTEYEENRSSYKFVKVEKTKDGENELEESVGM